MKTSVKKIAALALAFAVIAGECPAAYINVPAVFASEKQKDFDMNFAPKLQIEYNNKSLNMKWDKVNGAKTYLVYYYDFEYNDYVLLTVTGETGYSQRYTDNSTMFFKVCAKGYSDGKQALSKFSEEIMVCTDSDDRIIVEPKSVSDYLDEIKKTNIYVGEDYDEPDYEEIADETSAAAGIAEDDVYEEGLEWEEADIPAENYGDSDSDYNSDPLYYYEGNESDIKAGTLTAGELKDNISRTEYERAMHGDFASYAEKWNFRPDDRYKIHVTAGGKNAENCTAVFLDNDGKVVFAAKTNNKGTAYLFGKTELQGKSTVKLRVTSADGKYVSEKLLKDMKASCTEISFKEDTLQTDSLDVMLVVDTTGSMSDELTYIQTELKDVITRISKDNPETDTRVSVNFYRDNSDEYTVRPFHFTSDIDTAVKDIGEQYADGGGDYPEAVLQALDNAINCHDWRENSTKLMFLVLDAPPHDYDTVISVWGKLIKEASANGIRIIPVTASSTDEETEYLMRSTAVITGGTYVFLTDDSGVGNSHKKPTDSKYKVEKLNDLMVRVINSYIE